MRSDPSAPLFPADIQLEYKIPEGSTAVAEVAKCFQYCKEALASSDRFSTSIPKGEFTCVGACSEPIATRSIKTCTMCTDRGLWAAVVVAETVPNEAFSVCAATALRAQ